MRFAAWLIVVLAVTSRGADRQAPDGDTIIGRSMNAMNANWAASPQYAYSERARDEDGVRTYDVTMILGTPYKRLVASHGVPLSPDDQDEEAQKLAEERDRREAESAKDRTDRLEEYWSNRKQARHVLEEMPRAFRYRLVETRHTNGRDVYVLEATPRPGYEPPNTETRVLTAMRGEFWIDTKTLQWVKVTARALRAISIWGVLVRIEPGTAFELEQGPVGDGVWLPRHFQIRSQSRVLLLFHHRIDEDHTYYGYRRIAQ